MVLTAMSPLLEEILARMGPEGEKASHRSQSFALRREPPSPDCLMSLLALVLAILSIGTCRDTLRSPSEEGLYRVEWLRREVGVGVTLAADQLEVQRVATCIAIGRNRGLGGLWGS